MIPDELAVVVVEEAPPLADLEDDEVDEVDDEDDERHEEQALRLHGRDRAAAHQGQGHDGAEDVLKRGRGK